MPQLTDAAAAVGLEKVDLEKRTVTVLVMVMSPANLGGATCEDAAMTAASALQKNGGVCIREGCSYDNRSDLFCIKVYATYTGSTSADGWKENQKFTVKLGPVALEWVRMFRAQQEVATPNVAPISGAAWKFLIEEVIPSEGMEQITPAEPFSITVSRRGMVETFSNCYLTSMVREDREDGLHLLRSGTAAKRSFYTVM